MEYAGRVRDVEKNNSTRCALVEFERWGAARPLWDSSGCVRPACPPAARAPPAASRPGAGPRAVAPAATRPRPEQDGGLGARPAAYVAPAALPSSSPHEPGRALAPAAARSLRRWPHPRPAPQVQRLRVRLAQDG
jgi:hypothetical protein